MYKVAQVSTTQNPDFKNWHLDNFFRATNWGWAMLEPEFLVKWYPLPQLDYLKH